MMCFVRELIFRCGKEGGPLIMFLRKFMNVFFFLVYCFQARYGTSPLYLLITVL